MSSLKGYFFTIEMRRLYAEEPKSFRGGLNFTVNLLKEMTTHDINRPRHAGTKDLGSIGMHRDQIRTKPMCRKL